MQQVWMLIAGIAIVVAAVFLWRGDFDTAFVLAACGAVAWFLNYRVEMKRIANKAELSREPKGEDENQN